MVTQRICQVRAVADSGVFIGIAVGSEEIGIRNRTLEVATDALKAMPQQFEVIPLQSRECPHWQEAEKRLRNNRWKNEKTRKKENAARRRFCCPACAGEQLCQVIDQLDPEIRSKVCVQLARPNAKLQYLVVGHVI